MMMNKKGGGTIIFSALLIFAAFTIAVNDVSAATSPSLGDAGSYSILAGSTVTNSGPTHVSGDLGVSPGTSITGFPSPGTVDPPGTIHSNDQSAIDAQAANLIVFGALDQPCDQTFADGTDLTATFPAGVGPGVYCSLGSFYLTGNLNLIGSGVWVFKAESTLITSPGSSVTGGDPCNVWWRIGSSATLDTTTSFIGNILAYASITLNTGASLNGRALAQTGAVTLDSNTINGAICSVATTTSSTTDVTTSSTTDVTTSFTTVDDEVIVRTTVIDTVQSTTYLGTSPYLTLVSTIGTSTSTSHSTSRTTVGDIVTEYVTEFDTVYAYVLVLFEQEQLQKAVGGFIESANRLSILVPYLALFGAIAAVAVFVVAPWKKHED
jgi:hypothetical protein